MPIAFNAVAKNTQETPGAAAQANTAILPITVHTHRTEKTAADPQAHTSFTCIADVITPAEAEIYVRAMAVKHAPEFEKALNNKPVSLMDTTRTVAFGFDDGDRIDAARVESGIVHAFAAERRSALEKLDSLYRPFVKPADRETLQAQNVSFLFPGAAAALVPTRQPAIKVIRL